MSAAVSSVFNVSTRIALSHLKSAIRITYLIFDYTTCQLSLSHMTTTNRPKKNSVNRGIMRNLRLQKQLQKNWKFICRALQVQQFHSRTSHEEIQKKITNQEHIKAEIAKSDQGIKSNSIPRRLGEVRKK